MDEIVLTDHLIRRGLSRDEVRRLSRGGQLTAVRRGAYTEAEATSPVARHRQLVLATVPQLRADAVVSYVSAAVLHGLPVWVSDLQKVHLTRPRAAGGGKQRSLVVLHGQPLEPTDVTEVDGIPVTSLPRTVFDLARAFPFERAVAAGDRALALGMAVDVLSEMLERGRRWGGIRQARRTAAFLDGRADSAGESVSRVRCADFGLPAPQPQLPVRLRNGRMAYGDLGWPELRTIGEFDGRVKYEGLLRPGERASDAVLREKRREDELRSLGWQIVRWVWADLARFGLVREQLLEAFARGRRLAAAL